MAKVARKKRQSHSNVTNIFHIDPPSLNLLGDAQKEALDYWQRGFHLVLHGSPKTGKTHLAVAFALRDILGRGKHEKLLIVRSAVPSRDIGFLGGKTEADKSEIYQRPYQDIVTGLCNRQDAWRVLQAHGKIEFVTTSYLRGVTWNNAIVLVDESQNLSDMELHTTLTRIGDNCRVILTGDIEQNDLNSIRQVSGLPTILPVLQSMPEVRLVEFGVADILASEFVRSYMMARKQTK